MRSIRYHEAAEAEVLDEVAFLERRRPGLGRRFLAEIRRVEQLVAEFPDAAPEVRSGIRKRKLRTFPHSMVYTLAEESVLVLAVAHARRRPGYWVGRKPPDPQS